MTEGELTNVFLLMIIAYFVSLKLREVLHL